MELIEIIKPTNGERKISSALQKLLDKNTKNCHIILMSYGEDTDNELLTNCVGQLSRQNVIHTISIGLKESTDTEIMESCAILGNGYYGFIPKENYALNVSKSLLKEYQNND